jgi:hypothetical protein
VSSSVTVRHADDASVGMLILSRSGVGVGTTLYSIPPCTPGRRLHAGGDSKEGSRSSGTALRKRPGPPLTRGRVPLVDSLHCLDQDIEIEWLRDHRYGMEPEDGLIEVHLR